MRDQRLIGFARKLRAGQTDAEKLLWRHLRARQFQGHKFRRQYPIGPYIADFICMETKLIVELDGSQHRDSQSDEERTQYLEREGFIVLRFWNNDLLNNLQGALEFIAAHFSRVGTGDGIEKEARG